ncbi:MULTISPECIES: GntR family transcriptional regulator [unclassified Kribbella]|uniref:GntR family transcriptional regulator n=1 Tax=unclassified Kribbella TaxID=2644121 RepID=UPI0033FB0F9E|nr:GntR family transcriptional regulator [Kribbella sp. NBC_00889]
MTTISAGPGAGAEPAGVRHVKRPTPLRESVYEALTEMIIDGTLERGRHLVEVELAGMLGVSRQPVREALQRLNNEGWVDLRPGFGAMVHVPAEDEVDQLLAARAALESESARLAARHASKDDVARLRDLCKVGTALQDAGDIDGAVRTNGELHSLITQMSGNRFLVDFAGQVDRRVRWYYTPVAPVRGGASWREHARLVKAISEGDEDKSAQIMREHTEHTRKAYHDLQTGAATDDVPADTITAAPRTRRRRTAG